MNKGFKKLFIYKAPEDEFEFELYEDDKESASWDYYTGKTSKLEGKDNKKKGENSQAQKNDQNVQNDQIQMEVQNKLFQILKDSNKQADNNKGVLNTTDIGHNEESGQETGNENVSKGSSESDKENQSKDRHIHPRVITPMPIEELFKDKQSNNNRDDGSNNVGSDNAGSDNVGSESHNIKMNSENRDDDQKKPKQNQENDRSNKNGLTNVSSSLKENIKHLKNVFHLPENKDIVIREFNIDKKIPACLFFIDGMIDSKIINQFLLPELMYTPVVDNFKGKCPLEYIERNVISINQIQHIKVFKEIIQQILCGLTALFIEGCDECLIMESRGFDKRDVGTPTTETVVRGSQEGFTETLRTNITLIRKIVKSENLITEFEFISETSNYLCAIMYIEGITNPRLVNEVKRRIKSIQMDNIISSGAIEQLIEEKSSMLFPQMISTERPDRMASFILDGKVALICEGTPFNMAMPITFFDLFHTSEETNLRHHYGSFLRIIRIIGVLIAALLPGMYTALILFHQEMIPTALLLSIVSSRSAVPFPTIVEILLMEFAFELIREGGIRVPGVTGNTIGIIGALIMGQAAVSANLVSPVLIIIVAFSGLGSFAIPNYSLSLTVRIIRFFFIIFGCTAGFYGISAGFTIIIAFALSTKSFGVPFFSPIAPQTKSNKDLIIRGTFQEQDERPDFLNPKKTKLMTGNPRGWVKSSKGGGDKND